MTSHPFDDIRNPASWTPVLIIASAAAAVSLYAYFLPGAPGGNTLLERGWFGVLGPAPGGQSDHAGAGDLPAYALRFASSFLFLGALPLVAVLLLLPPGGGTGLGTTVGLCGTKSGVFTWKPFLPLWLGFIIVGAAGVFDSGLASYYPYSKTLTVDSPSVSSFAIHAISYLLLFYIPWELLFRGVLILPLLPVFLEKPEEIGPKSLAVASFQAIPSALLHFGHPISESLGAVMFGVLAGYSVLRYRSIWPGVILHASAGLALDLALTIKSVL